MIHVKGLSFTYPKATKAALSGVSFVLQSGELAVVCGQSASGKSTLLRLLKQELAPHGRRDGEIYMKIDAPTDVAFVSQNIEAQLVCERPEDELAFGLWSLGVSEGEARARIAEAVSYFNMEDIVDRPVSVLSAGQKQLLSIAAAVVTRPKLLLLDEPTSQLDPPTAERILHHIAVLHREWGTTVVIAEHRLEGLMAMADRVLLLDRGTLLANGDPAAVAQALPASHPMREAMPTPTIICKALKLYDKSPLTVAEGRRVLQEYSQKPGYAVESKVNPHYINGGEEETAVQMKDVWFRYQKKGKDILSGMQLSIYSGEVAVILGNNGAGKSTVLLMMAGALKPQAGSVRRRGGDIIRYLPQEPRDLFYKETVGAHITSERGNGILRQYGLSHLSERHPYDVSRGEITLCALAMLLADQPTLLLLDEPSCGLDAAMKQRITAVLREAKQGGAAVVVVTHDVPFAADVADRCGLMCGGQISAWQDARAFFMRSPMYTTAARRMSVGIYPGCLTAAEVVRAAGRETM